MLLQNTFTVPVSIDEAWQVMLDVEQLAPCMPGATVDQVDGDEVLGRVKVKLGPIVVTYRGKLTFAERDEATHRVVLDAAARELRGSGTARAQITASMSERDGTTEITVTTDLNITGKPAQFGRNVMADVSERIVGEFAANLSREIGAGGLQRTPAASKVGRSALAGEGLAASAHAQPEPIAGSSRVRPAGDVLDLGATAAAPILKRLVAPLALFVAIGLILRRVRVSYRQS